MCFCFWMNLSNILCHLKDLEKLQFSNFPTFCDEVLLLTKQFYVPLACRDAKVNKW